jgi:TRAP-type mannitol/chloroaromatic compound transport system permease small subunit
VTWSARLSSISEQTGRIVAWFMLPMVALTFVIVLLRYIFDLGWIWMQESVIWMHAAVFMLASAYTLKRDGHVRVDIFYRKLDARGKAWVNVGGTLLLLLPMMIFLLSTSLDYVTVSWSIHEGSREAGGMPFPFVPLLKSVIPFTAVLIILQGIANLLAEVALLLDRGQTATDETGRDETGLI